jgi:hypothetical protein
MNASYCSPYHLAASQASIRILQMNSSIKRERRIILFNMFSKMNAEVMKLCRLVGFGLKFRQFELNTKAGCRDCQRRDHIL